MKNGQKISAVYKKEKKKNNRSITLPNDVLQTFTRKYQEKKLSKKLKYYAKGNTVFA